MRRAFDMYGDDTDGQTFKYLNVFARIETYEKWAEVCRNLSKNQDEQYNPDALAAAASTGCPELGEKKLKELKKSGHPADRLQASFDKCWADARAHATGRDTKYDTRWKEMLANQGARIALLKTTSAREEEEHRPCVPDRRQRRCDGRGDGLVRRPSPSHHPASVVVLSFDDIHSGGRRCFAAQGAGRHRRQACCSLVSVSIAGLWLIRSPNYWAMLLCSGKPLF
jgi:hypothetical protein